MTNYAIRVLDVKMKINFDNLQPDDNMDLELIDINLDHIIINPDKRVYAVLVDEDDRNVALELNNFEASMLSFVHKGLNENSHIQTIYQLFLSHLEQNNTKIDEITIESKVGDILYCSVKFIDNNLNRYFSIVSVADALILHRSTKCKFHCVRNVWLQLDEIDDWDYEDHIIDIDDDE